MVRARLTREEIQRGVELGKSLRAARGARTTVAVAARAGLSIETVRKIEHGLVPTPASFTVAAMAAACGVTLDELAAEISAAADEVSALSA
jgi:transcriptional regulator with XRE-family HTH domain